MKRCEWCGVFVVRDTERVGWRVKVGYRGGSRDNQQNPRSHWNYWSRLLCPSCVPATNFGHWQRVTLAEVADHHARGWDPTKPYRKASGVA